MLKKILPYFNLENLILLTVFILPVYLIKVRIFSLPTNILEILITAIFILWFFNKKRSFYIKNNLQKNKYLLISIGIILSGLFISLLINNDWKVGLGIIKGWFLFPLLLTFLAAQIIPSQRLPRLWKAYYLSCFIIALVSLFFILTGKTTYDGRLQGFYNSPNYLAMQLAPAWIIFLVFFNKNLSKFNLKNLLLWITFLIILIAFYKTYSYAAWLAVFFSVLSIFLFKNKVSIKIRILILTSAIAFITILFSSQIHTNKFNALLSLNSRSSLTSRVMIWKSTQKMITEDWLWGIGPGTFQEKYLENQKYFLPYLEWAVPHPHNLYLAFWLYGGVLSMIGFVFLIFLWIKIFIKKNNHSLFSLISLGIIFYILFHGFLDTTYFKNDLAVVFWLTFLVFKKDS